jgi:glycosyltransferase involved in cell wall biosynthesis
LDENADIYHFHDPELLLVGALLKLHGKKVIYDVHEDFKGTMDGKQWIPGAWKGIAAPAISTAEAILGRACDRIVAATPTIARKFPAERTRMVQNFPWRGELYPRKAVPYEEREALAIYIGWLGDHSGVAAMTEAVRMAARQRPVKLHIGGRVREGAKAEFLTSAATENVEYRGFLNRPQVAELIGRARIGLVTVLPTGNSINAQPTKLFEYMSGALPVIASDFPVYRRFVEEARCGLLVNPHRPEEIASAILWMLENPGRACEMGRNGRRAIEEKYNWENEARELVAVYEEILKAKRGRQKGGQSAEDGRSEKSGRSVRRSDVRA